MDQPLPKSTAQGVVYAVGRLVQPSQGHQCRRPEALEGHLVECSVLAGEVLRHVNDPKGGFGVVGVCGHRPDEPTCRRR